MTRTHNCNKSHSSNDRRARTLFRRSATGKRLTVLSRVAVAFAMVSVLATVVVWRYVYAANILWSAAAGSAWLTGTNWTGNAVPSGTDVAQFGTNPTSGTTGVGINMNGATNNGANNQAVGAIEITSARAANHLVGNSSSTAGGTLTLNGATVNSVANVVVRNNSSQVFTIQNLQGAGTQLMNVALGNATDNIINIDSTGGITISSVVTGSGRKLTKAGAGAGILTLSGVNTYSGDTTITTGTLALSGAGSIANSTNIVLAGGSTFSVTGLTTALTLASGQGLVGSGTATTGTITVASGKGLTTASNSPIQFTAFNGTNAPLTVNGATAGILTLASTNPVTVNTTAALGAADYTLIAKAGTATVAGTAPTSLTIGGSGLASGATASLQITSGQLILHVVQNETSASVSGGVLTVSDLNGGTSNDTLTFSLNGANVRINDPNNTVGAGAGATQVDANTVDVPFGSITSIQVNTLAGNDTLTLNLASGDFIPSGNLAYAGGAQTTTDKLVITGGAQGTVVYNYTNANDGSVVMQNFGTVSYTGLEPLTNTGTATDITFNLPAGPNAVTLADDGTGGNTLSRLSGATFEATDFANPTGSVTINRGNSADSLLINSLPDFNATLNVGTGPNPFSAITFTGSVTLAANKDLNGFASGTINFSTAAADIATTGTGLINLVTARNIALAAGSSATVVNGTLTLSANNQATATSGDFNGVDIIGATVQTTGTGFINVTGRGGSGDFTDNLGVQLASGGQILATNNTSALANINVQGTGGEGIGGATAGQNNVGVYVTGTNSMINSTSAIQVTGEGGATNDSGSYGVVVDGFGKLQTSGPGALTINGNGGLVTGGGATFVNSGGIFVTADINGDGGTVTSTGTGANAGNINLIGVADNGGAGAAQGLRIDAPGTVTSVDGSINFDGTAAPCALACLGTSIRGPVSATGTGAINIIGTGAATTTAGQPVHGVNVRGTSSPVGSIVSAVNGNITVTGTGGTGSTDNAGFNLAPVGTGVLRTTGTGNITVIADTMFIRQDPGAMIDSNFGGTPHAATLRQKTNGVAIDLGSTVDSTAGTLELANGELTRVFANPINIGNTDSGAITVSANIMPRSPGSNLNLTSGGAINLNASSLNSDGATITLTPGSSSAVNPNATGTDVTSGQFNSGFLTFASGADLAIVINGTTVDTQYRQLGVAGKVNLTGVDLVLSGSHVPAFGDSFVIVNNDFNSDAVTGTFNGLGEGGAIPNFLGSALTARITYVGGDGNDVVLTVPVPTPPKYRSRQSGNWNDFNTWQVDTGTGFADATAGQTPTSADDTIQIRNTHTVTVTANVDADQLTVDSSCTLTVNNGVTFTIADGTGTDLTNNGTVRTAGNITNNGQATINSNSTLQIDQGGFPGGGTGTYAYDQTTATLVFNNTSGSFGVNNDNYWPTTNGPQNVNVQGAGGGITMNVARTVNLLFQYAAGVSSAGNLTLNGATQVNTGGFMSGSPTYGTATTTILRYNTGGTYGRNGEWLPGATSGAGYPQNVVIQNATTLDLPNGSTAQPFQLARNLTIQTSSTLQMAGSTPLTQPLTVLGNVTVNTGNSLILSTSPGGDIKVGGNWTRNGTATFTPNGRAVFFNGTGTQAISRSNGTLIETFAYLIVDKPSGTLQLSNTAILSVIVTGPSGGSALQIINEGGINLNGRAMTLDGAIAGTNILVGGATASPTRTITGTGTFAITNGAKSVTSNNGKTLTFDTGVNVTLFNGMDFGALLSTVNGTLTIGSGGFVNTNPPTYGAASTLLYDCTCVFARGAEWTGATSGPGAPNNVTTNTATDVNLGGASPGTALQALGILDAKTGGNFRMEFPGSQMTAALSVFGNVLIENGGGLSLSTVSGGDLKVRSDFTNNGTFTANNRAVFFEGTAVQNVTDASGTATMPYLRVNKGGGSVVLQSNLTALAPSGGDSIQFLGTTNVVTLNAKTLMLGSTIGAQPAGSGLLGDAAASLSLQDGGTGPGNAMGTIAFVTGGQSLSSLTLNRTGATGSATLGSPLSIDGGSGALALTAGVLNTGVDTLTMGGNATSTGAHNGAGASYVNGTMKKIYDAVPKNFTFDLGSTGGTTSGWTPAAVDALVTSATGDVIASVTNGFAPFTDTSKALERYWSLTNNGLTLVNLTFNYLDSDVPGTANEAIFVPYKIDGLVATMPVGTVSAATNMISVPLATSFSDWTAAEPNQPTAVKLTKFNGVSYADGVQLNWESGFEVNNLGYHLYREQQGKRARVTPAVVAGSALTVGPGSKLTAGYSYSWFDQQGTADTAYYLEAIDLNGTRQLTGPIYTSGGAMKNSPKRQRARLLSELRESSTASNADATSEWPAAMKAEARRETLNLTPGGLREQQSIASGQAVKIQVNRSGWYRLSQPELVAAGLDPTSDARLLQLYVDGVEVPIRLSSNGPQLSSNDTLEFYGVGLDTPTTDTRTYWLIKGESAGKRIVVRHGKPKEGYMSWGEAPVTASFRYTAERREKLVYLSHLLNGDADNIFGAPILSEPVAQTLTINNLNSQSSLPAQLEIQLQGLTAQEHQVRVQLNGSDVGTVTFSGVEHPVAKFDVNRALLHLGDNEVSLVSQNGDLDISFIDSIRLTYAHQYRADNNALAFSLAGGQGVRVGGFSTANIRVIDVTDPNSPLEVATNAGASQGGYAVVVPAVGNEPRNLIAFTDDLSRHPAAVVANNPSNWNAGTNGADLVIITHKDFRQAIEPLATLRRSQGLSVAVVDVEDVYDEFSYGAHTPLALKSFLSQAALNWSGKPGYLLLVGDSSWDPRNYFDQGASDFVPTKLIDTGYMETASDDWFADFNGAGLASMAIGRLPAQTPAEVSLMVGKILSYEQERELNAPLRGAVMVSDNGFESQSTQTQSLLPPGIDVETISRTQIGNDDLMRSQILTALNQGPMIVNYYGHGSVGVWTGEALLDGDTAAGLTNANRPSLYVLMTCLNGYSHDAYVDSLGESALKAQNGGAVAVWASSGFTDSQPQFGMDLEFYRQLFGAQPIRLGEAIRNAKVAISNQDVRRTWVLLGDPTMRMR
jgi:hypothetical protein